MNGINAVYLDEIVETQGKLGKFVVYTVNKNIKTQKQ